MIYVTFLLQRLLQLDGDIEALEVALGKRTLRRGTGEGHCSALIKVLPKNADLMVSQVTWNDYVSMLRIFKLYEFGFHKMDSQGGNSTFSTIKFGRKCTCNDARL